MPKLNLSLVQGNNLCMVETSTGVRVAQVFVSDEIPAPAEVAALFAAAPALLSGMESIHAWCYPEAETMPADALARCEWYARRLSLIANAATSAIAAARGAA
jgi:hypothetical protein